MLSFNQINIVKTNVSSVSQTNNTVHTNVVTTTQNTEGNVSMFNGGGTKIITGDAKSSVFILNAGGFNVNK